MKPPPGFVAWRAGRWHWWARAGYEALPAAWLAGALPVEPLPGGRGGVGRAPWGGEAVVVRPYRRGGWVRHLVRERYLLGARAFAETWVTERARMAGVPAPLVVAAGQERRGLAYRAVLFTRHQPGCTLAEAPAGPDVWHAVGRALGRLHAAGFHHPDLNLRNVLLGPDGAVTLLDFDRVRRWPGPLPTPLRRWALRRLARSARKLGRRLDAVAWAALRAGYATAGAFDPTRPGS